MGWKACVCVLVVAVIPLAHPAQTSAQARTTEDGNSNARDREARNLFEAGRVAYDDGRFEDALGHFEKAFQLSGRRELLYNIGTTAERLRRDQRALDAYEQYLRELPDADNRANVEARVAILRQALATRPQAAAELQATNPAWTDGQAQPARAQSSSITSSWWFWALVGGVVVAGGVTTALVLGADDSQQAPLPGRDGVVVTTLGAAP